MSAQIKNIMIFVVIAGIFTFVYIRFIKTGQDQSNLTSPVDKTTVSSNSAPAVDKNLLPLLLSVKNIKLDDTIFTEISFSNLRECNNCITLKPDGTEGRPNPFAPLGAENADTSSSTSGRPASGSGTN